MREQIRNTAVLLTKTKALGAMRAVQFRYGRCGMVFGEHFVPACRLGHAAIAWLGIMACTGATRGILNLCGCEWK